MICVTVLKKCTIRLLAKCLLLFIILLIVIYVTGLANHFYEVSFKEFKYPLETRIEKYVLQLRENKKPSRRPINEYKYEYIHDCKHKCSSGTPLRLVFLVKSELNHFERRFAIRRTWGFGKRFSDVEIRTVFLLGASTDKELQVQIDNEYAQFKDIVQINFIDTYYNNTIKTIMGFKWAVTKCPYSKFYMFCDDDMYISTKNVLRYVRHPTKYPEYLTNTQATLSNALLRRAKRQLVDIDLPDGIRFYSGFAVEAYPIRSIFSKWYISLKEYKYDTYPLYATAGAYILSKDALIDMFYTSLYTKHFRFDDVYLGILAHKSGILPYHSDHFHLYKVKYKKDNYKFLISSHGYDNSEELVQVWNEQRDLGNA